jgi:hypothetical protein
MNPPDWVPRSGCPFQDDAVALPRTSESGGAPLGWSWCGGRRWSHDRPRPGGDAIRFGVRPGRSSGGWIDQAIAPDRLR